MRMTRRLLGWSGCLILSGCGGNPDRAGFVLLSKDATSHVAVELAGWTGAPDLPMALSPGQALTLHGPTGTKKLEAIPGVLSRVSGTGQVDGLVVGVDIWPDRLIVRGDKDAVQRLADSVGATVTRRVDGRWLVEGPDFFERGSFLEVGSGIEEVSPDFIATRVGIPAAPTDAPPSVTFRGSGVPETPTVTVTIGQRLAALVGVYEHDGLILILDASGRFTQRIGCGLVERGSYTMDGDDVVLTSATGSVRRFRRSGESLVGAERFNPLGAPR